MAPTRKIEAMKQRQESQESSAEKQMKRKKWDNPTWKLLKSYIMAVASHQMKNYWTQKKPQFLAETKRLQEDETNGTSLDSSSDDSRWSTDGKT